MGTKISEFPIASTPLTGAELVPVVQAGGTEKCTVNDFAVAAATYIAPQFAGKLNTTGGAITANSSTAALSITQTGSGDALLVEDSASPDNSPFVVTATGSVGIGTTAPATSLEINAPTAASARLVETTNGVDFRITASGGSENAGTISTVSNHGIIFKTNSVEKARFDEAGNFGIGTNAPDRKLVVSGDAASAALLNTDATSASLVLAPASDASQIGKIDFAGAYPVRIQTDATERIRITETGNVGIGTASPTAKLHVAGNLTLAGSLSAVLVSNTTPDITTLRLNRTQAALDKKSWEIGFLTAADQDAFVIRAANDALTSFDTAIEINKKSSGFGVDNIQFFTNGNVQRAIFTNAGNVIFGTPTTTDAFILGSSTASAGVVASRLQNLSTTANSSVRFEAYASGSSAYGVTFGAVYAASPYGLIESGSFLTGGLRFNTLSSSNPFIFQANGTEVARITGTGSIGIGATSPTAKLEIFSSAGSTSDVKLLSGTADFRASINSIGSCIFGTYSSHDIAVITNSSERMRFDSSGRVGIGTSSLSFDAARLLVFGGSLAVSGSIGNTQSNSAQLAYSSGFTQIHAFNSSFGSAITFATNIAGQPATEKMRIDNLGNVGIGATSPTTIGLTIVKGAGVGCGTIMYSGTENGYIEFNSTTGLTLYSSQSSSTSPLRLLFGGFEVARFNASGCLGLGTSTFGLNATRTLAIANGVAPTSTVFGVGQIYVSGGALLYRGGSGTITTLAPA